MAGKASLAMTGFNMWIYKCGSMIKKVKWLQTSNVKCCQQKQWCLQIKFNGLFSWMYGLIIAHQLMVSMHFIRVSSTEFLSIRVMIILTSNSIILTSNNL